MFQQIMIIGYLSAKPELRFTPAGTQVANWSMASNRSYKKDDVWQDETTWWKVSEFGIHAETSAKHLDKGSLVLVIGRMQTDGKGNPRVYTRKDGETSASFEVIAEQVKFLQRGDSASVTEFEDGTEGLPF